jgi:hypothetical protein
MNHTKFKGLFILALLGALVATACDAVHVYTNTLSYPKPFLFGQAWWVFPGFVLAFLFMGLAYLFTFEHLPAGIRQISSSGGTLRDLIETITTFALVYLLSGFGNAEPVLLSIFFYGTFAARWLCSYDRLWLLILSVLMAVGGMFAEGAISAAGQVAYRHVDVFHVPWWLGGLYMHGAFALREGMRYLVYDSRQNH